MPFILKFKSLKAVKVLCYSIILSVFSQTIFAGTMDSSESKPDYIRCLTQGHFIFQIGGYWRNESSEQFINIRDLIGDRFIVSHANPDGGFLGDHSVKDANYFLGAGYFVDGHTYGRVKMSYGLNWFYLSAVESGGIIRQENIYENLLYDYKTTQYPLYAEAKSTIDLVVPRTSLTLNAGIGPNFMKTSDFNQRPIVREGRVVPVVTETFAGKTTTTFSATAGFGIQISDFFAKVPLECGYQFFYLGEGKFKVLNDQIQTTLKTGNLYSNALMCSILI